jgi:hypothetical protein
MYEFKENSGDSLSSANSIQSKVLNGAYRVVGELRWGSDDELGRWSNTAQHSTSQQCDSGRVIPPK